MRLTQGKGVDNEAARKRVAIELVARHEGALRRTARRYSLCDADADDAYQRGLEILLTKAPSDDLRELIRWTQTVVKHEALAVRSSRERLLGSPELGAPGEKDLDWVALVPAVGNDPSEHAERGEAIARSREALRALKPQELRALTLLAAGYTYAEIGEMTGYSQTKINRCLAEGRERFRNTFASSDSGSRCMEMRPMLSAFCDGEANEKETRTVREHLRACAGCRATMRAYRAAPRAAAALAPALPVSRSMFERAHEALAGLYSRLPGQGGGDSALSQIAAAGGSRGAGMTALAKVMALCVGTAGGAAACVATGVAPVPLEIGADQAKRPALERPAGRVTDLLTATSGEVSYEPAQPEPAPTPPEPEPKPEPEPAPAPAPASSSGAVEFTPEAAPAAAPAPESGSSSSSSAAGEFGP